MLECQTDYVVRALEWMDGARLPWIDVRPEVEARYNEQLQRDLDGVGVWAAENCHNYYRGAGGAHRDAVAAQHERVPAPDGPTRSERLRDRDGSVTCTTS